MGADADGAVAGAEVSVESASAQAEAEVRPSPSRAAPRSVRWRKRQIMGIDGVVGNRESPHLMVENPAFTAAWCC
jgi:hypothetical protein